jgi:hypothetical protein
MTDQINQNWLAFLHNVLEFLSQLCTILDEGRTLLLDVDTVKRVQKSKIRLRSMFIGILDTTYCFVSMFRLNDANKAVVDSREKIERQNQQLSDYEAEINLLRRRLETLESDRDKDKKQIATLQDALNRVRMVRIKLLSN